MAMTLSSFLPYCLLVAFLPLPHYHLNYDELSFGVSVCKRLLSRVNSALVRFHGPHPPRSLCHQPRWGPMIHVPPQPEHRSCPIQLSWLREKGHFFLPFGSFP
ncbi:hypothetical protein BKA57DRAFT_96266 [Linnemannia elongata]|nr:hypothetical protein BKA57DRAFT_96266 [Linnemannia elongata]